MWGYLKGNTTEFQLEYVHASNILHLGAQKMIKYLVTNQESYVNKLLIDY